MADKDPPLSAALARAEKDLRNLWELHRDQEVIALEAEEEMEKIRDQISEQIGLVDALITIARKYGAPIPESLSGAPAEAMNDHLWQSLPRTEAIIAALREIEEPVGPKGLTEFLHEHGRDHLDSASAVSATLGHLAESNRVVSVGRGQWTVHPSADVMGSMAMGTRTRLKRGLSGLIPTERSPEEGAATEE